MSATVRKKKKKSTEIKAFNELPIWRTTHKHYLICRMLGNQKVNGIIKRKMFNKDKHEQSSKAKFMFY